MGYRTYPRSTKYPKKLPITVVAKTKWDIPVVCQYPEIITMFDVAGFKQHMSMIFSFIIYNRCTCSSQNIQYKYRSHNLKDTKSRKHQSHQTENLLVCSKVLFNFFVVEDVSTIQLK